MRRAAFLAVDLPTLDRLWTDDFAVNSPLQRVLPKQQLLELLRTGRIRHTAYECEIEYLHRQGDVVVVMGRDRVEDPADGGVTHRRYTNLWRRENGGWRSFARHAHVMAREPKA